jgi:CheY-like chemotaxis protein
VISQLPPDNRPDGTPPRDAPPPEDAATVLVVEDEGAVRRIVRRLLEQRGYRVLEATNGGEALDLFERHWPTIRLLVTDIMMPGVDGRELVVRLRQRAPALRVLFMSGYSGDAVTTNGELVPGAAFMEKPFTIETFTRRIEDAMGDRAGD